MPILIIIAVVAFIMIVKAVRNNNRRVTEAWQAAASRLGLSFDPGSLTRKKNMQGILHGNRVEVATVTRNAGSKGQHTATRYRVLYPKPLVEGLQLKPQGLFSKAAAFLGAQKIETGDKSFDTRVLVKGSMPKRVIGFLTPERRREVLRLFDEFKGVKIDDQSIEWFKSSVVKSPADIVATVERLSSAAELLSGTDLAKGAVEDAVLPIAAATTAAVLMDRAFGEPASAGKPAAAQAEWNASIPSADAVSAEGISGVGPSPEPEPASAATTAPTPATSGPVAATPATPADELAAAAISAKLFARGVTSTEAKRLFEELYKDKRVSWTGNLRRAAAYSIDLTFKGGKGTKATFALGVSTDSALGGAVQAVVQLAPDAAEQLRSRIGEEIGFEGRLLSCETLLRTFNVADARLI